VLAGDGRLFDIAAPDPNPISVKISGAAQNRLEVYDATTVVAGEFAKLGEVALAVNVAEDGDDFHHYPRTAHKFSGVITADGTRIILSGTRGIAVLEVPPQ
jgi:hypothetical protein